MNSGKSYIQAQGTVKHNFNECWSNQIFSKTKCVPGPNQFSVYLFVNIFHFNKYHLMKIFV